MTDKVDYAEFATAALEMIADFGFQVVWEQPAAELLGQEPWRGERVGQPVQFTPDMVFMSPIDIARGRGRAEFGMFQNGTDVVSYNEVGLLAGACGFEPSVADVVIRDGKRYVVAEIDKIAPDPANPVLYFIAVK